MKINIIVVWTPKVTIEGVNDEITVVLPTVILLDVKVPEAPVTLVNEKVTDPVLAGVQEKYTMDPE